MKSKLKRTIVITVATALLLGISHEGLLAGVPPNIIIILTDDHGFTDLGVHGVDSNVQTPALDSLAAGGALIANGYASAPQCVPSRAGLMSGRIQNTFGTRQNGSTYGANPLPLDVSAIAERVRILGTHRTGMVGKWHLTPPPDAVPGVDYPGVSADYKPQRRGFDEYWHGEMSPYEVNFTLAGASIPEQNISDPRNRVIVQGKAAEAFIARNQSRPFFLYLAFYGPHLPRMNTNDTYYVNFPVLDYPQYSAEMDNIRRLGLGLVRAIDDAVGGVMQKLREMGLEENTLILFAGDNGAQPKFWDGVPGSGTLDSWTGNENLPLRGEKGSLWEGGIKVPMLAYWKGHIPAGQVIREPVWTLDFTATALKLAGGAIPAEFDGVDILPRLTGATNAIARSAALFWDWGDEIALREGDWKIHRIGSRRSLINLVEDPYELYDLKYVETNKFQDMEAKLMARYNALPSEGQSALREEGASWYETGAPTNAAPDPRFIIPYINPAPAPYPAPLTTLDAPPPLLDSDGDGMSDARETAGVRKPNDPSDLAFEFDSDGDYEGWVDAGFLNFSQVTNGALSGQAQSGQGKLEHFNFAFNGSVVSNLLVRLHSPNATSLAFRWGTRLADSFGAPRIAIVTYPAGLTNTVIIPLGGSVDWHGQTITRMRLNPANTLATFTLDWIRASDGDYDDDGFSDADEAAAGTDLVAAEDFFRVEGFSATLDGRAEITVNGRAGHSYTLLHASALTSSTWTVVSTLQAVPSDGVYSLHHTNTSGASYYRLRVNK